MNKQETIQIITLLAGNYDKIAEKTKEQKQLMINTWFECLNDLDYNIVLQAVKKTIIESPYPPTIHDLRKNAIEIVKPTTKVTAIEAWDEARKMIRRGSVLTKEEFEAASPMVQKFFGDIAQVRELGRTDSDIVNSVTKGQFLKQYDVLVAREKEEKLIPDNMKELIGKLTNKMDIKMIGGNK